MDVTDIMEAVNRWNLQQGDLNYLEAGDVNGDGVINIVDIQQVAAQWGVVCPAGYSVAEGRRATDDQSWCGRRLP